MVEAGLKLRAIRTQHRLSLREVEGKSLLLAEAQGNPAYRISASWLNRLERGRYNLTVHKLVGLAFIFGITPEQLLRDTQPIQPSRSRLGQLSSPNSTMLLTPGALDEEARHLLQGIPTVEEVPDETRLLPIEDARLAESHYRKAVIGRRDCLLSPMIPSGSVATIDTKHTAFVSRTRWNHEFQRPIYFLLTHQSYICSWCDFDNAADWLTLVPHPLSRALSQRLKYRKEIENLGRVVAITVPWGR